VEEMEEMEGGGRIRRWHTFPVWWGSPPLALER
jgi:hypothetical protein